MQNLHKSMERELHYWGKSKIIFQPAQLKSNIAKK